MPTSYKFSEAEKADLEAARRKNKNKNIERRLKALLLRAQGVKRAEVAQQTGVATSYVSELTAKYRKYGIEAITGNHYKGNRRNLSYEEEEALLEPFREAAAAGSVVEVSVILHAYEEKLGRTFEKDHGRIYRVLARHNWRKVMPRSKHPDKASEEDIESSKKLTPP